MINVIYALDASYLVPLSASVVSLLVHNAANIDRIFILQSDLTSDSQFEKLRLFVKAKYQLELEPIHVDRDRFSHLRLDNHVTFETYYRLHLANLIPESVHKILYLDPDTIITSELTEFNRLSDAVLEAPLYAVSHQFKEDMMERVRAIDHTVNDYFNAGVLFINLNNWRKQHHTPKLEELLKRIWSQLKFHDQDLLNVYFNGEWEPLPFEYNAFQLKEKLSQKPKVIHYTGISKPWNYENEHPYKSEYQKYLSMGPFNGQLYTDKELMKVLKVALKRILQAVRNLGKQ